MSKVDQHPILITLCCESLDDARSMVNEALEELRLTMVEKDPDYGLDLPFIPDNVGVTFPMDSPYEISVKLSPVKDGVLLRANGEVLAETLLTMRKDPDGGRPDPKLLKTVLEFILSDVLELAKHVMWDEIDEVFGEGTRPILMLDPQGRELTLMNYWLDADND